MTPASRRHRVTPLRPFGAALLLASALPALSADLSLSGSFQRDDDVRMLTMTLTAPGAITVTSIGYAGGVAYNGQAFGAGGFDSFLYSSSGTLLAQSDDGVSVPADPATGLAADAAFTTGTLAAGVYTLALTQYDNFALGDLAAGFSQAGNGNFTPGLSGTCPATSFCDWDGNARTALWALNFSGQTLASAVPEPASVLLMLAGAAVLAVRRRTAR